MSILECTAILLGFVIAAAFIWAVLTFIMSEWP